VAEREVRLARAKWIGHNKIRLRFDPFAYRYIRLKVLQRDRHTCYWCGSPGYTIDHVIPWSQGGRTTMNNCICACSQCNGERGDTDPVEFARLKQVPPPAMDRPPLMIATRTRRAPAGQAPRAEAAPREVATAPREAAAAPAVGKRLAPVRQLSSADPAVRNALRWLLDPSVVPVRPSSLR
jgi:hypothetical protein